MRELSYESSSKHRSQVDSKLGKYLTFQIGTEEFAVKVLQVREIIGVQEITPVPQTPSFVKGVTNLRGKVIPIIDLRLKFGLPESEYGQRTCIVITQVQRDADKFVMGMVVDGVSEVLSIAEAEIEPTPDFGDGTVAPYLLGMAKVKDKVKIVLDIDRVLTASDVVKIGSIVN